MIRFIYKCHACGCLIAAKETCDLQDYQAAQWVAYKINTAFDIPRDDKMNIQGRVLTAPGSITHKCNSPCEPQGITGIATLVGYREEK